jgi:UDP-glucose 4-epimerase
MVFSIETSETLAFRRRYFVTGGAGFIGSNLVDALLREGHEVYTIDDLSTGSFENIALANRSKHHYFFEQNVLDFDWDSYLKPGDHIMHLAAAVGVDYVARDSLFTSHNNLNVTQYVLEKCRQHRCSMLYTSTSEVYGNHNRPYSSEEDHLCMHVTHGGRSAYTLSKLYGEFMCQEYAQKYDLQITVLRLFNTIGNRQSTSFGMVVPRFINHALRNECITVYGAGDQTRSFCHVSDTVKAICKLSLAQNSRGDIYNVGNDVSITVLELAKYIKVLTNSSSKIALSPFPEAREGEKDIRNRKPDISKIMREFQWQPEVKWQDALIEIVENAKQQEVIKFA